MDTATIPAPLKDQLRQILGEAGYSEDVALRRLMSQDIWAAGVTADFVIAPDTVDALQAAVRACHGAGVALHPRGGGMSYTSSFTPDRAGTGILDLSRLNRIVEINAASMYVTAEAGVTWKQLYDALKPLGLRTPFWGPLSGLSSTVGGGVSQNNAFFGAGTYGTTGDSVMGLTIILADGTRVRTGTGATRVGKPFWRSYGPDLTGLFCGDSGAMGIKAEVSFRLVPWPEHEDWASFEFSSRDGCAEAMAAVARENIACEVFGFDPALTRVRLKRASLAADTKTLANVMKAQGSLLKGLQEGAKVALAGRNFMEAESWSLHVIVEGRSKAGVAEDMKRLKTICERHGGKETENSIPKIIRANPFTAPNTILGPEGERWVPVHGIVAMEDGPKMWAALDAYFASITDEMARHRIEHGYLVTTLSTTGYLIEPVFLWPEELLEIHEEFVEPAHLKKLKRHASNPEATEAVKRARRGVIDLFDSFGAAHFQIGRSYPYADILDTASLDLLKSIKALLDPNATINPGALGL
ncbi:FAD-binding oxidoreductase [Hyphomonas sp.]|uniref:FAD-binding oxidoreductase n=1 Tax=Hyphomonas sp. TaxID=87 RepID=UPI00391D9DCD